MGESMRFSRTEFFSAAKGMAPKHDLLYIHCIHCLQGNSFEVCLHSKQQISQVAEVGVSLPLARLTSGVSTKGNICLLH
jgi:hypothetical protein